jgi:hypothetical protein
MIARAGFGFAVLAMLAAAPQQVPPSAPAQQQPALPGVWQAMRVNEQALPMTDRVVGEDGFTHVVRLHEMLIRMRANGRFQATLRYRRAILQKGEKIENVPLQNDLWAGTYTLTGTHLHFVPEKQGKRQVQPFEGEVQSKHITVGFDYEIVTRKHYTLELARNDSIL